MASGANVRGKDAVGVAECGITLRELADYTGEETERWFEFFREKPEALNIEIGGAAKTVLGLLLHIITVEYRYVERVLGKTPTEYDAFRGASFEDIKNYYAESRSMIEEVFATATLDSMNDDVVSQTKSFGEIRASKRKVLVHMFLHGMRHWAQVAMAVRQAGFAIEAGKHDLIFSSAIR
jgi:uncharacterized damage-inducible protein DinB